MINKDEIEKIALLAKLDLSEEEKERYSSEFSGILSYIDDLSEIETEDPSFLGLSNDLQARFREDLVEVQGEQERELSLKQAREIEDGQVKVKRVLR